MEINEKIEEHGSRIEKIEEILKEILEGKKEVINEKSYSFTDKSVKHNELLKNLLKSEYCHSQNGLSLTDVLEVFKQNKRPIIPKKIKDLLAIWKKRKKIEAVKEGGVLKYFWIENE